MEPDRLERWLSVVAYLLAILIATVIFIAQVLWLPPNELLIGAGIALYLLPWAREADIFRRRRRDDDVNDGPGGYWRHP